MSKKVMSVLLVAVMVVSMVCVAGISASAFSGGKVYVELPEAWAKSAKAVYCHIWKNGGDELYAWQTKNEKMTEEGNNKWSYEIPAGDWDMVIFSTSTGVQTYDLTLGDECVGDTAYVTDEMIENPMDSDKMTNAARWRNNGSKYGPHFAITSIGNVVGEVLAPGEDPQAVLDAFIANYPDYATDERVAELRKTLKLDSGDNNSSSKKEENKDTSSKSSTASTGTTKTGDSTPFVALAVLLVAALGVAVIASKKKVSE